MKIKILGLLIVTLLTGCASDETFIKSEQAIADLGYTNVSYEGYTWFGCDSRDQYRLKYTAISQTGRQVELAACSAPFKGVTVRTIN